jgi:hypothetical protein
MLAEPRCSERGCIHLLGATSPHGDKDPEKDQKPCCEAFPDGIPDEIAYGDNKHLEPYQGDHGIRYEGPENTEGKSTKKGPVHKKPQGPRNSLPQV